MASVTRNSGRAIQAAHHDTKGETRLKLEVAVKDVSPTRRELTVEVPVEEVTSAYDKVLDEYTRYARIPGFRQGRAPRSVVKQRFSKELKEEVISKLLPHALSHAVADNKLQPIGEPDLQFDQAAFRLSEPLRFGVNLEVAPEFELLPYRGIKLNRRNIAVTEEDVDKFIEEYRQNGAEFVTVDDRPAEMGDFVSVNLVGKYVSSAINPAAPASTSTDQPADNAADLSPESPDEKLEDLKAEDLQVELGGEGVQPEFTSNLIGVKADDVREFRVAYPEDFTSKGLAGRVLDFTLTVVAVRRKELPTINDENVAQFGPFETVEQMRRDLLDSLRSRYGARTEEWLRQDLLDAVISSYDFEIPEKFFQAQYNHRAQDFIRRLFSSRLSPEQLAAVDVRKELKRLSRKITEEIRTGLVLQRIGQAEGITTTDEEVAAEIASRAAAAGVSEDEMYDRLTKNNAVSSIETSLFYDKTVSHLLELAEVTATEITTSDVLQLDAEARLLESRLLEDELAYDDSSDDDLEEETAPGAGQSGEIPASTVAAGDAPLAATESESTPLPDQAGAPESA